MLPDWVLNPGPLTNESGALPVALRGPAQLENGKNVNVMLEVFLFLREKISR